MHIEPYEQAVAAPERKILDDAKNLLDGGDMIEVVEVGREIHAAQRLCGGEINRLIAGNKTARPVKARFEQQPADRGVERAIVCRDKRRPALARLNGVSIVLVKGIDLHFNYVVGGAVTQAEPALGQPA